MNEFVKENKSVIGIALAVILTIGVGILIAFSNTGKYEKKVAGFSKGDPNSPKVSISEENFDLGTVPYTPPTEKTIKIKNEGKSNLQLTDFKTSCGCTFVVLKIPGKEDSPKFEMHNNPTGYVGELEPGVEAELLITFDPKAHNITGSVERTVFFNTNDPEKQQAAINFKANVEKGDHEEHH